MSEPVKPAREPRVTLELIGGPFAGPLELTCEDHEAGTIRVTGSTHGAYVARDESNRRYWEPEQRPVAWIIMYDERETDPVITVDPDEPGRVNREHPGVRVIPLVPQRPSDYGFLRTLWSMEGWTEARP